MKREQFISLFFIVFLIFIIYQIFLILSPFFNAIFWSAILAFSFYPIYVRLRRRLDPHETAAALLMTSAIFLIVIPPVALLIINLTAQAIDLYQAASDYIHYGGLEKLVERIRALGLIQNIEARLVEWEPLKENAAAWILNTSRAVGNFAAAQAGTVTKNLVFLFLNVTLMFFLIFAFLKDGEKIYNFIYQLAPLAEENKKPIFERIHETFSAVIRGQLLTGFTQAIIAGIVFWLLGLSLPVLFATLTFMTALIPVVGAAAVWFPLVIYLVTLNQMGKAAILFLSGTFVISLIDNIMKPALIGEKTKLPYVLLFFGILGGIKLYGLTGIFIAPAVLSVFFALAKIYKERSW